jgi:hypothetical protein
MVELLPTCDRDLPTEAQPLAQNTRYSNQAFRMGEAARGQQFQEVTADAVHGFLAAFPTDAARALGGAVAVRATTAGRSTLWLPGVTWPLTGSHHWSGAREADRWMLDLVPVSPIFLHCELWQSFLPLRQLRPTLGAWSLTKRFPRSPRVCARNAPGPA